MAFWYTVLDARTFLSQIFSSSISSFLILYILFFLPFSSRNFRVIRLIFYISTFTSPITTIKWRCLDPPLRIPEQTLPGTAHRLDPGRPSAIFSTPLRPTAFCCVCIASLSKHGELLVCYPTKVGYSRIKSEVFKKSDFVGSHVIASFNFMDAALPAASLFIRIFQSISFLPVG